MKKRILSIIVCLFLLLGLTACGDSGFKPLQKAFNKKVQSSAPSEDKAVAKNDKYTLHYDPETLSVNLEDNATGTLWEVCPTPSGEPELDEFGLPALRHGFPQSAIEVGYMDPNINGGGNQSATTYDSVIDIGRVVLKEIENGVTIEYYFESQEFMVPVNYVLCDDYLSISVDSTKIQENSFKITYVKLAPFICSVENDTPDSYMFIPSGSGALVDTKSINEQGILYNAFIYGDDLTMEEQFIPTNETSIRLPVYGYKSGEKGGFAIIEQGADTAVLNASSGNTSYGFSAVYPEFQLRGYTPHKATTFNNTYTANIYPTHMIEETVSIRFYPLSGEKANYNAMADIYRDYLVDEKGLKENDDEKSLSVNILGGTMITKSFLGIPYQTLYPTTTVKDAESMVSEISKDVDNLAVKLKGFGSTGVDIGKIGGGFTINSNIGSAKELKNLSASCNDKKVDLYMDYDIVKFNGSGSGFSYFNDVVMNSGSIRSEQYIIDRAMRNNEEKMSYRLLRPIKFNDAVLKSLDKNADWNITGVSFDTLSTLSYSDYSDYNNTVKYNAKQGFADAVSKALANVKKDKQKLMASSANVYAALNADLISETPISSDNGHAFTENIPFYAMVFKGYIPMTSESINTAADTKRTILGAVEGGIGLNYTLISNWDNSLIDALYPNFYSTVYSGVKDSMLNTYNDLADYYDSINGAKITSNEILAEGVHSTTFDNGVTVYVNYNTSAADTSAGKIPALGYIVSGGAK